VEKFKVNGQSVAEIKWKQTNQRTDGRRRLHSCRNNAVGKYQLSQMDRRDAQCDERLTVVGQTNLPTVKTADIPWRKTQQNCQV